MNEINVMHKDRIYNSTHSHFICFVYPAPSALGKPGMSPANSLWPGLSGSPCSHAAL